MSSQDNLVMLHQLFRSAWSGARPFLTYHSLLASGSRDARRGNVGRGAAARDHWNWTRLVSLYLIISLFYVKVWSNTMSVYFSWCMYTRCLCKGRAWLRRGMNEQTLEKNLLWIASNSNIVRCAISQAYSHFFSRVASWFHEWICYTPALQIWYHHLRYGLAHSSHRLYYEPYAYLLDEDRVHMLSMLLLGPWRRRACLVW